MAGEALRQKARDKAAGETSTEVAQAKPRDMTTSELVRRMEPEIKKALPRGAGLDPERISRVALTVLRQTPALQNCDPYSFLGALMVSAQLGLEPGPLGLFYLVPFGRTVTPIIGYQGMIELARRSGLVKDIYAEIVTGRELSEGKFRRTAGLDRRIEHEPVDFDDDGQPVDRESDVVGVYAVAKLTTGEAPFEFLTVPQVEAHRARSKAGKNGPWVTDWIPMAKKTAIRALFKWLPKTVEAAHAAAVVDEQAQFLGHGAAGPEGITSALQLTAEPVEAPMLEQSSETGAAGEYDPTTEADYQPERAE
jgi:recombination protein RecT